MYDGNQSSAIKIQPSTRRNGPKMAIAQSLPIAVPIFNHRIEDDYEEVKVIHRIITFNTIPIQFMSFSLFANSIRSDKTILI